MEIKYEETYDRDANISEVAVQVSRFIRVDGLYKITPTEAFLGIDSGTVRVLNIVDLPTLVDISDDLRMQADEFARVLLDVMDEPYLTDEDNRMSSQPWVVYQYTGRDKSKLTLPLEEFVIHTTQY